MVLPMSTITNSPGGSSHHRLIQMARWLWVIYAVGLLLLFLTSLPGYVQHVTTGTVPDDIIFDVAQPTGNTYFVSRAERAGLTLQQYVAANTAASASCRQQSFS